MSTASFPPPPTDCPFLTETDEPKWRDCGQASAVMAAHNADHTIPVTSAIREQVDLADGNGLDVPTYMWQIDNALMKLFGHTGEKVSGEEEFIEALQNGAVAHMVGQNDGWPMNPVTVNGIQYDLRRWDRYFTGGHAVAYGPMIGDLGWLRDPEGRGDFAGEWVPWSLMKPWMHGWWTEQRIFRKGAWEPQEEVVIEEMTWKITKFKVEPWVPVVVSRGTEKVSNGVLRETPDRAAPVVDRLLADETIYSFAEIETSDVNNPAWRVTQRNGKVLYMLRGDWNPVVPGGNTDFDAVAQNLLAGKLPDTQAAYNKGVVDEYTKWLAWKNTSPTS